MTKIPIGLQMYTLRAETSVDFVGTLKKVADLGFAGVEFAGFGNLPAAELKSVLGDLNLRVCGAHIGVDLLTANLDGVIEYQLEIGNPYIVVPYLQGDWCDSTEAWIKTATTINEWAKVAKAAGIGLAYHNHDFEYKVFDGKTGMQLLEENTDTALVKNELDLYWVTRAGNDPANEVKKYAGRLPLLHIKDMANDEAKNFAEFGEGVLDWDTILPIATAGGTEWFIVEQDRCINHEPLESIAISMKNLKARGLA